MGTIRFTVSNKFSRAKFLELLPFVLLMFSYLFAITIYAFIQSPSLKILGPFGVAVAIPIGYLCLRFIFRKAGPPAFEFEETGFRFLHTRKKKFISYESIEELKFSDMWIGLLIVKTKKGSVRLTNVLSSEGLEFLKEILKRSPHVKHKKVDKFLEVCADGFPEEKPLVTDWKKAYFYMVMVNGLSWGAYAFVIPLSVGLPFEHFGKVLSFTWKMSWAMCFFASIMTFGILALGSTIALNSDWAKRFSLLNLQTKLKDFLSPRVLAVSYVVVFGFCMLFVHTRWMNDQPARELASTIEAKFSDQK